MKRGRAIRVILGLVLIAAAAIVGWMAWQQNRMAKSGFGPAKRKVPRRAKSILIITTDTTRADHLSPYGADNVTTPNIQKLADNGILFENAESVAPITLVAHTSIMTGLLPPQHGVRNNGTHYVPKEVETLAERLKAAGYHTGAIVSAAVLEKRYGLDQGFDWYDDDLSEGRERSPRVVPDRPAEFTVNHALEWLNKLPDDGKPFFLWVHFYDPHGNYSPPPPYRDQFRERLYDGEIAYMDHEIGRLLADRHLRGDEVITTLLADHGESLGEHGENTHAILVYESTLHVPFIMHVPGGPKGLRIDERITQVDLVPTLLDLLGMKEDPKFLGKTLVPLIEGRGTYGPRPLYSETYLPYYTYGWAKLRALREGRWKYIDAPTPELYDLKRDPRELSNLYKSEPGEAHDLTRDLKELLASIGNPEKETELALDSESMEKLRALGYIAAGNRPLPARGDRPDPKDVIDIHTGLERARQLTRDRLYSQAIDILNGVMRRDPNNLAAIQDLATNLRADGQLDKAREVLQRGIELDPDYANLQMQMADLEAASGELGKALELDDLALKLDPNMPEAYLRKSQHLRQAGKPEKAREALEAGLKRSPEHPLLNVVYARTVEVVENDLPAAEARLRKAVARDPFLAAGWEGLGAVLEAEGRVPEAIEAFKTGLSKEPDDVDLHGRLGLLQARAGQAQEAEFHLREAIRLSSTPRSEYRVTLGALLAQQGRLEEADAEYEKVLENAPHHPAARNNMAIAYYQSGRRKEAEAILRELVKEHPDYGDAHNNLAAILIDKKDWTGVEREARAALKSSPNLVEAWNNLGISLAEQNKRTEAKAAYEHALKADPEYWQARQNLADTLRALGDNRTAADNYEKVLQQVPTMADAHYALGELYGGPLDDSAKARVHWNAFLRYAPRDPRAPEIRKKVSSLKAE